jgi:hypothetical protein
METYNLGKIEILKDPRSELKKLVQSSYHEERNNSGFTLVYGNNKEDIESALDNLGFRLPSIKECIYIHRLLAEANQFDEAESKRIWVETEMGPGVLIIRSYDDLGIWTNPPETLNILFAVKDSIPS